MTTTTLNVTVATVNELNALVADKNTILAAFDRFYADDVVMSESSTESTAGKRENREREVQFVGGLTKWEARLLDSVVDESRGLDFNRWHIEFEHAAFGAGVLRQISAQQWRDGKIVNESFYKL